MSDGTAGKYDAVPYPCAPYPQSHPDRLATIATLFGMQPAPVNGCRVLELGCGDGGNLIPMALGLPGSQFVGIEASSAQWASGCQTIARLGLTHIELQCRNILDVNPSLGEFDYLIAHGVFSWISREVQDKVFEICRTQLSPAGVAYISYNTNPGWRLRGMIRDIMLYHTRTVEDPRTQVQQARAVVRFLANATQADQGPYALLLKSELAEIEKWDDAYFLHDSLEDINDSLYFHEFVSRAEAHGLQFLGEAEFHTMMGGDASPEVRETLRRLDADLITTEQYLDFVRNRMFRQSLLCHRHVELRRRVGPDGIATFYVASPLRASVDAEQLADESRVRFIHPSGPAITLSTPLVKVAFELLADAWPAAISRANLIGAARSRLAERFAVVLEDSDVGQQCRLLDSALLTGYSQNLLELRVGPLPLLRQLSAFPTASPLARLQAERGEVVTNQRMEQLRLDSLQRQLISLLDGTRNGDQIVDAWVDVLNQQRLTLRHLGEPVVDRDRARELLHERLGVNLQHFASSALLIA